jgi:hypothetical protein
MPILLAGLVVLIGGFRSPSSLLGDIIVSGRLAREYVSYSGGYAIDGESGAAGSDVLFPGLLPQSLDLTGTHHADGEYAGHTWSYDVGWNLHQSWGITQQTIMAEGSMALAATGSDTFGIDGWNNQEIYFDVTETTGYDLTGYISGRQTVDFQAYNETYDQWFRIFLAYGDPLDFSKNGTLNPGLYRLINNPYSFTADANSQPVNEWTWTIGFQNGTVSAAVPEPGSGLAFLSLSWIPLIRRRRAGRKGFKKNNFRN